MKEFYQKLFQNKTGQANWLLFVFLSVILLFQGCTESTLNTDSDQTTAEVQTSQTKYQQYIQEANSHYYQLAEMIPGFGGVFLEEKGTRFVIRTTDVDAINKPTSENNVKNYLQKEAPIVGSSVEGGVYGMDIRFAKADYEYNQLSEWQDQITESVLDSEGVTFIAISHKHNKIEIGIEKETFKNQIIVLIKANNLPEDAIKTTVTGPIESLMSHHTLRDMQRPLRGGLENNLYNSSGNRLRGACTYSFNALRNGVRHWVTNTHCTRDYWGVNQNDEYYQASIADGTPGYVGYEVMDPQGFNIPFLGCSSTPCRFSDAALLRLPGGKTGILELLPELMNLGPYLAREEAQSSLIAVIHILISLM